MKNFILSLLILILFPLKTYSSEDNFIKIAYYENFFPFSIKQDGVLKGIFVEYIEYLFSLSNDYKIISDGFPWERAQDYVRKNMYDAHITLKNPAREEFLLSSNSIIFEDSLVLIYSINNKNFKDIEKISKLDTLKSYSINDYLGNSRINMYPEEKGFKLKLSSNIEDCFLKLFKGDGDVIITSKVIADLEIRKKYKNILKIKNINFLNETKVKYFFMIRKTRKDADNILKIFEKNIKKDKNKEKFNAIYNKYINNYDL
ncbi:transporter substrate-binding domain-containing protein [Pigmentibacter sp. JX0631]|uniref:substrate-binding periplasmic protein n=1 Tax=Pigmentibacter sp. JX0631 TaxID=2976982 RepID=UPI00246902CE|nr:transporter substrate-binding domain-containing protein [Pigmentibacter sp. JX0631]WGL60722.1 transporter substrate-binding domain-containing protein [Pigmentibacter sp. JX0631]